MHDFHRRADRLDVGLGERAPPAADRIEDRPRERRLEPGAQNVVHAPLGDVVALGEQRLDRQRAERQARPGVADVVVHRLGHFEAAAAHVADRADRPEEAGDDPERGVARLLRARQDPHRQPGLRRDRGDEVLAIGRAADRLGRGHVELRHAHRLGDGAKAARGLHGAAEAVRRDGAGLRQPFRESGERFLVEARQGRAAKLVVDHEPHRIRADVDDAVMRPLGAHDAGGIEFERPMRRGTPGHNATPQGRRDPMREDGVFDQTAFGRRRCRARSI